MKIIVYKEEVNMKVIFFGAGSYAKFLWEQINKNKQLYIDKYMAFADNNENLWGRYFCEKRVISPNRIKEYEVDLIIIASTIYEKTIRRQLIEGLGIPECKIYIWEEYARWCYARSVYRKRYDTEPQDKSMKSLLVKKMPIVIYTAITGNYDRLKDPLFVDDNLHYVCFTNNPNIKSKVWNVEFIENANMDNVHLARHIKINPHLFFPEYELSVWVDGKYQIKDDLREYVLQYQKQSNILCFPHPQRSCICDELAECILWTNGNKRNMIMQVGSYLKRGYPVNNGLFETGCMLRFHNEEHVKILMSGWENDVMKYSIRDQLSFPYVCWKNEFIPDICDLDVNHNRWLQVEDHTV